MLESIIYRNITKWFMGDVLPLVSSVLGIYILYIALRAFILGERSIAPTIFINSFINLFLASLWGLMFSAIFTFYACPLICEHYIDLSVANQNIWEAIRKWLGTN